MKEESIDRLFAALERFAFECGLGMSLEEATGHALRLLDKARPFVENVQDMSKVRAAFADMPEITEAELVQLEAIGAFLPQIFHQWGRSVATGMLETLPPEPGGRPNAVRAEMRRAVCDEVAYLQRQGATLPLARQRVAQRHNISARSVARIWSRRADHTETAPPIDLDSAKALLLSLLASSDEGPFPG